MADLRGLSVNVPIKFSKRAQRELYDTCMVYKELAELRGAENDRLRELVRDMYKSMDMSCQFDHAIPAGTMAHVKNRAKGLRIEVPE